ncbi:MAG: hypothetical protein AAGB51_15150 [Planctomycetota bacterium]
MSTGARPNHLLLVDEERISWVRLPAETVRAAGRDARSDESLVLIAELSLTDPIENYFSAVSRTTDGGAIIAAWARRDGETTLARSPTATAASPSVFPRWLLPEDSDVAPAAPLNFLTGADEPASVRRLRRMRTRLATTLILLLSVATLAGIELRRATSESRIAQLNAASDRLIEETLGPSTASVPPTVRLISAIRGLGQDETTPRPMVQDVCGDLAALLTTWPDGDALTFQRFSVDQRSASVSAFGPTTTSVNDWVGRARRLEGWAASQPQIRRQPSRTLATVTLRRSTPAPSDGGRIQR